MRTVHTRIAAALLLLVGLGSAGTASAAAGSGLSLASSAADLDSSAWQGRIVYAVPAPVWRSGLGGFESGGFRIKQDRSLANLNLLGDYFFDRSLAPSGGAGGLRATSGVIIGTRSQLSISQPSLPGGLFGAGSRVFGKSALPYSLDAGVEPAALPYVGVGYTGLAPSSGWSFSADLGVVGGGANNAASRLFGSGQRSLDDATRDMRLVPLVQLGVQYSF